MNISRIVLVNKRTVYEELVRRHGTHGNAAFVLRSRGEEIEQHHSTHARYQAAVARVVEQLPKDLSHTHALHADISRFLFRPGDLVVVIGPDGLFVNVAKYLSGQPVIAVNPDLGSIDGVAMRTAPDTVAVQIAEVRAGTADYDMVTLAEATTPEGGRLLAVNDFLVGRRDQVSARYRIAHDGRSEQQSSSGVLVSTGMGASGWYRAIRTGVHAGNGLPGRRIPTDPAWDERRLVFAVREPFPSKTTGASIVYGSITDDVSLTITSDMPEGGVIFSDGVLQDALLLPAGLSVTIRVSSEQVRLVRP